MKLTFQITALSRETGPASPQFPTPISAIKVVAKFRAPAYHDSRVQPNHPAVVQWIHANQNAAVTFFVPEPEGAKLHIDQEFEAELHGHHAHDAA
jgi:hypothetical protein